MPRALGDLPESLGFRFKVGDIGFRVWGLGFRINSWGFGFRCGFHVEARFVWGRPSWCEMSPPEMFFCWLNPKPYMQP